MGFARSVQTYLSCSIPWRSSCHYAAQRRQTLKNYDPFIAGSCLTKMYRYNYDNTQDNKPKPWWWDSLWVPYMVNKSNKACSRMPCDNIDTLDSERSYNYDFGISKDNRIHAMPQSMNAQKFQAILSEINTFIFDADGVLWLGEDAIPGSPKFIDFLLGMNKRIIVLTNNATKSRAVYAKKLAKLGYDKRIGKHNIVNPAAVVADTLFRAGLHKQNKKVYLIGGQGVKDELDDLNIEHFGDGPDPVDAQASSKGAAFLYDIDLEEETENVGAVVVGYEKYFNYLKLMKAANYLQQEDCLFVATNEDETCPGPNPSICIPDAGPLVAAVKSASGREPLVVGKPNTPAFDYICRRWQIDPTRTMMIGDRTNTDVKFGKDHGLRTMLVLSGCHQVDDIVENQMNDRDDMVPEYYAPCLGALIPGSDQTVPTPRKLSLESI